MEHYVVRKGDVENNELYHYGVLGMKWGVRRGRVQKAYNKASKKLDKLDRKIDKQRTKAEKKYSKYTKLAGRSSFFRSESDIRTAKTKFESADARHARSIVKAKNWYDNMEKTFKNTNIKMTKSQQAMGKSYADELLYRRRRSGFDAL